MGQIFSGSGGREEDDQVNQRPTKKAKLEDPLPSPTSSKAAQLISLLVELNEGNPLDLASISAINSAFSPPPETSIAGTTTEETLNSTLNKLFTEHVGQSPQIVIDIAIQFASDYYDRETDLFNDTQMRGGRGPWDGEDIQDKYFSAPGNRLVDGPRPVSRVWLALFLGKERVENLLVGSFPLRELHDKDNDVPAEEHVIWKALKDEVTKLPQCDLLLNILSYVRNESWHDDTQDSFFDRTSILRFAVLYGLDGVMRDFVKGRYVDLGEEVRPEEQDRGVDLTIDTLLELSDKPIKEGFFYQKWFMSPMHLGAILGYSNIVVTACNELGGNVDAPLGMITEHAGFKEWEHCAASQVMQWVILNNMKPILKTLVEDCGFQFRWVFHANCKHIICKRIFDLSEYEMDPRWKGALEEGDIVFECSRVRRGMRSAAAYKEQMKMLDYLIDLGLPFALLFPTEVNIDALEALVKAKKLETRKQNRDYMRSLSSDERAAIELASMMASSYNSLKNSEAEMLELRDYYRMLKKKWEWKKSQVARLDKFEALDPTWRAERKRQEDGDSKEDDSGDELSYGSGSSYEFPGDY